MTWDELVEQSLKFFQEYTDEYNCTIEDLDGWNGFLDGQRREPMEYIDDYFRDSPVRDIIDAALSGTSENGSDFDPDESYFYWDWNQLVSTDAYDYSDWLDGWFVKKLYDTYVSALKRGWSTIDLPEYIKNLFDEYIANEEPEEE